MSPFEQGYALLSPSMKTTFPSVTAGCCKDIHAVEQVLTHPERCAYPTDHVKTLSGKNASRQCILDGLDWLRGNIQDKPSGGTTAVIYYSGHGWRDESVQPPVYYLIPYDVKRDNIALGPSGQKILRMQSAPFSRSGCWSCWTAAIRGG